MALVWIHESPAMWDAGKARVVGGEAPGVFDRRFMERNEGDLVPGEWWRVEDDGEVVGYGWLDVSWGDAEILLATERGARGRGVGSFILEHLADEAHARGLNYMYNVVRTTHPEGDRIRGWLEKRGFSASENGKLYRSIARPSQPPPPPAG